MIEDFFHEVETPTTYISMVPESIILILLNVKVDEDFFIPKCFLVRSKSFWFQEMLSSK